MVAPGRDAAITAVVVALMACAFAAVGDHGTLASIQRLDDAWLRLMISGRVTPLTAIAKVFNVLGHEYVTLPVRIAIAGLLALRRWWWASGRFRRRYGRVGGTDRPAERDLQPCPAAWAARGDERCVVFPPGTQLPRRSLSSPRSLLWFRPGGAAAGGQRPLWSSRS
jgi:hypothetical protein